MERSSSPTDRRSQPAYRSEVTPVATSPAPSPHANRLPLWTEKELTPPVHEISRSNAAARHAVRPVGGGSSPPFLPCGGRGRLRRRAAHLGREANGGSRGASSPPGLPGGQSIPRGIAWS